MKLSTVLFIIAASIVSLNSVLIKGGDGKGNLRATLTRGRGMKGSDFKTAATSHDDTKTVADTQAGQYFKSATSDTKPVMDAQGQYPLIKIDPYLFRSDIAQDRFMNRNNLLRSMQAHLQKGELEEARLIEEAILYRDRQVQAVPIYNN